MKFSYPLLENAFTKSDISEGIKVIKSQKLTMLKIWPPQKSNKTNVHDMDAQTNEKNNG